MKSFLIVLLFIANAGYSQMQGDIMVGVAGYSGDLTKNPIPYKTLGPALSVNLKYPIVGNFAFLRAGISYGWISGDDKHNTDAGVLQSRNLNFKSQILEGSLCAEINLLDPADYIGYPYLFAGVGLYHFNPYTQDKDNKKTFLWDLGTEGQGLAAYPTKKCIHLHRYAFRLEAE
jgi:hypothetical protein